MSNKVFSAQSAQQSTSINSIKNLLNYLNEHAIVWCFNEKNLQSGDQLFGDGANCTELKKFNTNKTNALWSYNFEKQNLQLLIDADIVLNYFKRATQENIANAHCCVYLPKIDNCNIDVETLSNQINKIETIIVDNDATYEISMECTSAYYVNDDNYFDIDEYNEYARDFDYPTIEYPNIELSSMFQMKIRYLRMIDWNA